MDRIRTPFADPMHEVRLEDPAHRRAVERAVRCDGVCFAAIDSLSGASQGDENAIEVLGLVKWLAALARDTGKAILLLHHLGKPGLLDSRHAELARARRPRARLTTGGRRPAPVPAGKQRIAKEANLPLWYSWPPWPPWPP